jgi:glycosyltransferase 2 family protein
MTQPKDLETAPDTPRRASWRVWLSAAGLVIGAAILGWQLIQAGRALAAQPEMLPAWPRIGGLVVCALASHTVQMSAWRMLMHQLGAPLSWRAVFGGYMLSFLPRYIPGSAWGYLSRGIWFQRHGVPPAVSALSSILETVAIVGAGAGLALGFLFRGPGLALAGPIFTTLAVFVGPRLLQRYGKHWSKTPVRQPTLLEVLAYTCMTSVIWLLFGVMTRVVLPDTTPLDLVSASTSYYVAWLGGALAVFVPAGLGVRELAFGATLATFGVTGTQALTVPALLRLAMLASESLWLVAALMLNRTNSALTRTGNT